MEPVTEAVRRDLESAFAGAVRSARIRRDDRPGDDYFDRVNATFHAEPDPPTDAFLKQQLVVGLALEPGTAAWFWGAALTRALENPAELLHSALYFLRGNPCSVLSRGGERELEQLRDGMTPAQRLAIGHFLRHVMVSENRHHRLLARQAVLWCWRVDTETIALARALHAADRAFVRPTAATPELEALIVAIETAFEATPIPTHKLVTTIDEETAEYVLEFQGARWQCFTPDFIDGHYAAWSFFMPDAFRAYLPAAMRASLLGSCEVDPIFHLVSCVMDASSFRQRSRDGMRRLSPHELAAVIAYLRHHVREYSHQREAIEAALRDFYLTL